MNAQKITAEELGLTATVDLGPEAGNFGFSHRKLAEAFKKSGLRPVSKMADFFREFFGGFEGYIPDEAFFTEEVPDCPVTDGEVLYRCDYLSEFGGWPPNMRWLLEKE